MLLDMKQINVWFEDKEHSLFVKRKDKLKLSWHDFLLYLLKKGDTDGQVRTASDSNKES